jgi:hypothetical protein
MKDGGQALVIDLVVTLHFGPSKELDLSDEFL